MTLAVRRLDHIGVVVPDPAGAAAWLADALGADVQPLRASDPQPYARIALDGGALMLTRPSGPPERAFPLANCDAGAFHICLRTADIDAAYERLTARGARFSTPPERSHAGPVIAYFRDPLGIQFQLIQVDGGPLAAGPAPGPVDRTIGRLHHVGLTLPDLDGATAWFEQVLGLPTMLRTEASGELPSRMLDVPDAAYRAALVQVGEQSLELMEFDRPSGRRVPPGSGEVGALRLCFEVDAIEGDAVMRGPGGLEIHLTERADA